MPRIPATFSRGHDRIWARLSALGSRSWPAASLSGLAIILIEPPLLRAVAAEPTNNSSPGGVIMINPLGQAVTVSTNALPPGLLPPARVGLDSQVPTPARGGLLPQAVVDRLSVARSGQEGFELLPAFQPQLMPYLASQDEFGNTSIKPGPLIPSTLLDELVQRGKFWISEVGLRYSLQQTFTWVGMTDVMQGSSTLGFYTFDFAAKWALFASPSAGT
ncbi:MAG TPA: hypothetical protein DCE44_19955, partial [Verrucomicrobiales bacterium]|nr:hypothetical protein [Verrucomicrobiales bacterium]